MRVDSSSVSDSGGGQEVRIPADRVVLEGNLGAPLEARGVVMFAHGSGSSRHSPRNRYVAQVLQQAGIATLLFDLLTREEEPIDRRAADLRFDIPRLAQRLIQATDWLSMQPKIGELKIGYFGASTGAAAALVAAAEIPHQIAAVVSRGGRPDLAASFLPRVQAPTLLLVGGEDPVVLDLNSQTLTELRCEKRLEVIMGATHLFDEPGALEEVARLARDWFDRHFGRRQDEIQAA